MSSENYAQKIQSHFLERITAAGEEEHFLVSVRYVGPSLEDRLAEPQQRASGKDREEIFAANKSYLERHAVFYEERGIEYRLLNALCMVIVPQAKKEHIYELLKNDAVKQIFDGSARVKLI
ncbi:hypothetical protein HYX13_05750 [Candidatus Woesearchaeota archaeon]|nr:hypothetical protein [Candidatus Woesearchaeota archaeon]